jgi:hypothetical protein
MNRDELETLGMYALTFILCMFASGLAGLVGYFIRMQIEPKQAPVACEQRPLTYDQQHLLAYDFMVDNPHVRQKLCEHRFVQPMDSNGSVK